jgi:tRNA threonylcarbamoyladenosine biosynthesis protein TsaE
MIQRVETIFIATAEAMEQAGAYLAKRCQQANKVIFLEGNLGAGKTTLVRGFLTALGHKGNVKSPTFTLVEDYALAQHQVFHFDLYRLSEPEELEYIGIRDYLQPGAICLFEWPEKAQKYLPIPHITCYIDILKSGRNVTIVEA